MSRIQSTFTTGKKILIGYMTAGYPSPEQTVDIVRAMSESGCDIIELGIPFSDPLGDGPTIQHSSYQALQQGVNIDYCFDTAKTLRKLMDTPLVFMTYYNPVFSYGLERFCAQCKATGVDGIIIPDAPPEECEELETHAIEHDLDIIYLLAPTSTSSRIKFIAGRSRGFIYLVSSTGVTGTRDSLPDELENFVSSVRSITDKPLCVGFGISTPEQAAAVAVFADGIILGSKIIQTIDEDPSLKTTKDFISSLRQALDNQSYSRLTI